MNRSYSQSQEIDCSCFDFRRRQYSYSEYGGTDFKPFIDARKHKKDNQGLQNPTNQEKFNLKKSLKRKYINQSMKQTNHKSNKENKNTAHQTSTIVECKPQNTGNYPVENLQQINVFDISQDKFKNSTKIQKQTKEYPKNNKHEIKKIEQIFERKKMLSIKQFQQQAKKEEKPMLFLKQKKSLKNLEPSDVQSQSKTIKKKPSLLVNRMFTHQPSYTYKYLQQKNQINQDTAESWKKYNYNNYKGESIRNFARKLKNVYPKQIQSFQSEEESNESLVIERGRFTWAPEGTQKPAGFQFISSLNIKEASRRSKMLQSSGRRV